MRVVFALLAMAALAVAAPAGHRLIEFNETNRVWMSPDAVEALIFSTKFHNFMDVTDFQDMPKVQATKAAFPNQPMYKSQVESLITLIDGSAMKSRLETLSSFFTRYCTSQTGLQAADWLFSELNSIKGSRSDISIRLFKNTFLQPSIIVDIQGEHEGPPGLVILGSHIDSIGSTSTGAAPGADDDGSGTICNIEVFRIIVKSGFIPARPISFQFYAGEEAGLLGSQAIAQDYSKRKVNVYSMMQLDMTMYANYAPPIVISPITDFTDPALSSFMRLLIDTYTGLTWEDSRCGYGCSDHASWTKVGVPAVFPFEAPFSKVNPNIHSARDTVSTVSIAHGEEFVKMALGYIVELSRAK